MEEQVKCEEPDQAEVNNAAPGASAAPVPDAPEKRRGFHPALVAGTVIACLSVLWIGPKIFMWARIEPSQQAALSVLEKLKERPVLSTDAMSSAAKLQKNGADTAYSLVFNGSEGVYEVPRFYGDTAVLTYCLKNGKIYSLDIKNPDIKNLPPVDNSWKLVGADKK